MNWVIRDECAGDESTIHALTEAAFRDMPFSDGVEQHLVDKLRSDGDLALSLLAETPDQIVGHIAFSRVTIEDGSLNWYGLGPVSVWPELQRKGIGSALIRKGIEHLRGCGANGVVLLGNPEYYSRFGFAHDPKLQFPGPSPEYFQRLVLAGNAPAGKVSFPAAFG